MHPDETVGTVCRCGHPRDAHEHYRGGTDCSLCLDCARFRPSNGALRRLVARLLRRS